MASRPMEVAGGPGLETVRQTRCSHPPSSIPRSGIIPRWEHMMTGYGSELPPLFPQIPFSSPTGRCFLHRRSTTGDSFSVTRPGISMLSIRSGSRIIYRSGKQKSETRYAHPRPFPEELSMSAVTAGYSHSMRPPGTEIWRHAMSGAVWSSPAVANGMVYVMDNNGYLAAINTTDGLTRWSKSLSVYPGVSPTVADGIVYAGTRDGEVYAYDARHR